jgi:AAA+ ATPase superfamily predicted ATPase
MDTKFLYDNVAFNPNFFGRESEISKLNTTIKYSNNILIYSKRRMGKTTLIKNFLNDKNDFITLYIDIFDITSKEDFALSLLKSLSNNIKYDLKTIIKTLTNLFKRVRVEPTIDPNTLEYSIKPIVTTLSFEQMIEDFFSAIEQLSKKHKIIIAIDEFQQITTIKDVKLDAILRKYIQERQNISYIFLGSKRHTLTSLFSYKAPLYELATHFELPPLKIVDIYNYAKKYLDISIEQIEYIYNLSDGETKLILHILHLIYISKNNITNNLIDETSQEILNSKDTTYRMLFDTLNNNQKLAIKLIGKYGKNFYNQELLQQYNIKKQTLKSAIDSLFAKEIIDKQDSNYFVPDRTFELWIQNRLSY